MTTHSPSDVFQQFAYRLQLSSPKEWEEFVQMFDAFATEVTVAVTRADQSEILNKQGQAQAFLHLLQLMRNCHKAKSPTTQQP